MNIIQYNGGGYFLAWAHPNFTSYGLIHVRELTATQKAQESEKALRYIQQLDEARCNGSWKDVPELCRKVEKHAPHRRCLTLTARSEAQVAAYITQRPTTNASTTSSASSGLSQVIPLLLTAIEERDDDGQEAFQATVCLGWLHYVLDEPGLAVGRLPNDFSVVATQLSAGADTLSSWTRVCLIKGTYVKASALEKTGAITEAVAAFSSIVPWLAASPSPAAYTPQLRMWSEHLIVRLCQLSDQSSGTAEYVDPLAALQTYRYWAKFYEGTTKSTSQDTPNTGRAHRLAWKAYFNTLSTILQHNLPYEPESAPIALEKPPHHDRLSLRMRQRAELKRVETVYERLLIKDTQFPRASENNHDIEAWVESVIQNWRLLCGPSWSNDDLGEGGKEGVARSLLDILYRAATKTFHSTQILRYLFIVHASLAEFDVAFKAYESYFEIITRGKDRAEKTGGADVGIDDDSTILRTSAEAIRLLCRFGTRKEAEKALEIGQNIEKWMEQSSHSKMASDAGSTVSTETQIGSVALAVAYCAIGVSQAHWARLTYNVEARTQIQAKAVQYLRKSLSPGLGDPNNLEALYALALVLAETRDILGAIKVVKRALSPVTRDRSTMSTDGLLSRGLTTEAGRERKLIPLWHLLALLLTSRSDFSAAEKACEAAFQQFGDTTVFFGADDSGEYRSEHLNHAMGRETTGSGIVDRMEAFEKSNILQIKITQLALLELTDGPSVAVDGCDELISLYSRLFNDPSKEKVTVKAPATLAAPPKSAVGTIRNSIFRGRDSIRIGRDSSARNSSAMSTSAASTVGNQGGVPPAIQVTNNDNTSPTNIHHHHHHLLHLHKHDDNKSGVRRTPSKLQKRSASLRRSSVPDVSLVPEVAEVPEVPPIPETATNGSPSKTDTAYSTSPRSPSVSSMPGKSSESGERILRPVAHNMSHASPPIGHTDGPTKQDARLPTPVPDAGYIPPDPHFSTLQERRHRVSLLSSIWIFISGLYTRAQMFEDAQEAAAEAFKLAEIFESEASLESSTAKALSNKGWGGGKSVEELWADAFAARGELQLAQSLKHPARSDFESALLHFPDHPEAIVGVSNILLDIYSEAIPFEPPSTQSDINTLSHPPSMPPVPQGPTAPRTQYLTSHIPSAENQVSPPELNRLAARDRAFGLLSTLTKLGVGWDYSEAWYALARAYEESGQIEKTKEVLWWCVELEDTHPLRAWRNVNLGGYVL